jgi:NAD+ synthase (glutamine-hydrolysing)
VGANDELIFDGHSVALNAQGEMLALARKVSRRIFWSSTWSRDSPPPAPLTLPANQEEQLFRALVLGVRDYVGKCRFKSVVLGFPAGSIRRWSR